MTEPPVPRSAGVPWDLALVTLTGVGGHALLFLQLPLTRWLLPLAAVCAWFFARPRWPRSGPFQRWTVQDLLVAAVIAVGCVAIAWGSVATQDRSWDGFCTWSLTARHLLAGEGLDAPYFADPTVFHYARGYPLLQPILLQQTSAWLGVDWGRILFPLLWLFLLRAVSTSLRTFCASDHAHTVGVLGIALVPLFTEPGHGSAESGFADLLVAALLVHGARAVLADAAGSAACIGLLLPLAKNEGVLHLGLLIAIAAAAGHRRAALGAAVAGTVSLLCWLPVQTQLIAPGGSGLDWRTLLPALGPGLACAFGAACRRWPRAWLPLAIAAALVGVRLAGALPALASVELNWSGLPAILGSCGEHLLVVRKFGASFLLLIALALLAFRERAAHPACWRQGGALLAFVGLVSLAIVLFLLTLPAQNLALFLREGLARYLAQTLGVVWLANGLLVQALRPARAEAPP